MQDIPLVQGSVATKREVHNRQARVKKAGVMVNSDGIDDDAMLMMMTMVLMMMMKKMVILFMVMTLHLIFSP